jgi:hypothetical protein
MARNLAGTYSLPSGSLVTDGVDDILASQHNTPLLDIAADLNTVRPIVAGGTGASTPAGALVEFGLTATAAEINTVKRHRQLAQGTFSGAELIFEVPTDIEATEICYWRFLPSTVGADLKMQLGSGTIGSPVWGTAHAEQGLTLVTTTPSYYSNTSAASVSASVGQIATGSASGRLLINGFQSSGAVQGEVTGRGLLTGPARGSFTATFSEESAVTHTLIRLFVSSGTMAGVYRIYGFAKP